MDATTGGIKSGVTWTIRRCIDGTFAAGGGTVTEDSTNGWYKYAMSQADTNGNNISFNFTGTGAVPQTVNIITTACDPTTATNFGITSLPTTAVTTNASLLTSGTGTDQLSVTSGRIDVGKLLGTAWLTPTTAGTPDINLVQWLAVAPNALQQGKVDAAFALDSGTAQAGASGTITLRTGAPSGVSALNNCVVTILSGTGTKQSRLISAYNGGTKVATITPNWSTSPDNTSVYLVTPSNSADVELWSSGVIPAPNVTGVPLVDDKYLLGTIYGTPATAGVMDVNAKNWGNSVVTGMPMPTYTQPTGFLATTFPSGTVANTTNITAGTVSTVTTLTNLPSIPANWLTAAGIAASALNGKGDWLLSSSYTTPPTTAAIATGVWQDTTAGDFTVASSIGKSLYTTGAVPGAAGGLFIAGSNAATTVNFTGNLSGSVGSVTGAVGSVTAGVTVTTNNDKTGYTLTVTPPTAAAIATTIWQDLTAGSDFGTAGSIGALLKTDINAPIGNIPTTVPLTAAQIATGVWTDTTAGDFTTALSVGKSLMNGVSLGTGLTVARCTLADTLTTYTGNTPQTGDNFARIGATGSGLTSLAPSSTALSTATWTGALATNLGTLAGHDPGTTLGTSTLTQAQVTGGAYALNSASFAFNAALDFATTQKTSLNAATPTVTLATSQPNYAPAKAGDAMALTVGERSSVAAAVWAYVISGSLTALQYFRLAGAALFGKRSNGGTVSEQYDDPGAAGTPRIVGNLDGAGNGTPTLTP